VGSSALVAAFFALAATAQVAPIPDPAELLSGIVAAQGERDQARESYTYRWHYRVDSQDAKGNLHPVRDEEYDAFFVNGHAIRRLLKRSGQELSVAEQEREEARARDDIDKFKAGPRGTPPRAGLQVVAEILSVAIFSNARRISLNGRDTLAFDFAPGAHANFRRSGEGMSGTIWIDEADREIARFEGRHDDPSRRGAVLRGNSLKVEQAPVGDGIWMPVGMEQDVASPKGLVEIVSATSTDFRKFDVQSTFRPK
jgi:hypothetical protein